MAAETTFLEKLTPNTPIRRRQATLRFMSPSLDREFFGIGGLAPGVVYQIWGKEGEGKTTLAIIIAALYQRQHPDKWILWLDAERTFDREYAELLGLKVDLENKFYHSSETVTEKVLKNAVVAMGSAGEVGLLILDSVGAMQPGKHYDKIFDTKNSDKWTTTQIGSFASPTQTGVKAMKTAHVHSGKESDEPICLLLNHVRPKIGLNPNLHYLEWEKYDYPGGQYLKHTIEGLIWVSKQPIKVEIKGKVKKSKKTFAVKMVLTRYKHGPQKESGAKEIEDGERLIPNFVVHLEKGIHPSPLHRMINERILQDAILGYGDCSVTMRAGKVIFKESKSSSDEKAAVLYKKDEADFWADIYDDPREVETLLSLDGKFKFMQGKKKAGAGRK